MSGGGFLGWIFDLLFGDENCTVCGKRSRAVFCSKACKNIFVLKHSGDKA